VVDKDMARERGGGPVSGKELGKRERRRTGNSIGAVSM